MKKLIYVGLFSLTLLALFNANSVNGQSFEPKRYEPNIFEDEIIFCVKDVKNNDYFGQVSCFIEVGDNLLNNTQLDKIADKAYSLDNTFEMGLID